MDFASEDIGNADPQALVVTIAAFHAFKHMGQPDGEIPMAQAVVYLATAPKSNASYMALSAARAEVNRSGSLPVPLGIRNAPTKLMKELGYGSGYKYDHSFPDHFAPKQCLPDGLEGTEFYKPGEYGFERDIAKRMEWWEARRRESKGEGPEPSRKVPKPSEKTPEPIGEGAEAKPPEDPNPPQSPKGPKPTKEPPSPKSRKRKGKPPKPEPKE